MARIQLPTLSVRMPTLHVDDAGPRKGVLDDGDRVFTSKAGALIPVSVDEVKTRYASSEGRKRLALELGAASGRFLDATLGDGLWLDAFGTFGASRRESKLDTFRRAFDELKDEFTRLWPDALEALEQARLHAEQPNLLITERLARFELAAQRVKQQLVDLQEALFKGA